MVYTTDLKSVGESLAGSSPALRTNFKLRNQMSDSLYATIQVGLLWVMIILILIQVIYLIHRVEKIVTALESQTRFNDSVVEYQKAVYNYLRWVADGRPTEDLDKPEEK